MLIANMNSSTLILFAVICAFGILYGIVVHAIDRSNFIVGELIDHLPTVLLALIYLGLTAVSHLFPTRSDHPVILLFAFILGNQALNLTTNLAFTRKRLFLIAGGLVAGFGYAFCPYPFFPYSALILLVINVIAETF